jgi:hypothetical protein
MIREKQSTRIDHNLWIKVVEAIIGKRLSTTYEIIKKARTDYGKEKMPSVTSYYTSLGNVLQISSPTDVDFLTSTTDSFTFMLSFYINKPITHRQVLLSKGTSLSSQPAFVLAIEESGRIKASIFSNDGTEYSSITSSNDVVKVGKWNHTSVTFNDEERTIQTSITGVLGNELILPAVGSFGTNTSVLFVGKLSDGLYPFENGIINDIQLYKGIATIPSPDVKPVPLTENYVSVPDPGREIYDKLNNTSTRIGLGTGQTLITRSLGIDIITEILYDPDIDFSPINIAEFNLNHDFSSEQASIELLRDIYETFPHEVTNQIFFRLMEACLSLNVDVRDIMKTSYVSLKCSKQLDTKGDHAR